MLPRLMRSLTIWSRLRDQTDERLLDQFFRERDESAFALIVRRHGPMVLGVCRRLLRDPEDVEDAFQATFLILVKKGPSLGRGVVVGAWLHGVARRTALKARTLGLRRRERQVELASEPAASEPPPRPDPELRRLLDEEIENLPTRARQAVVACYLEGRTRGEAARQLGWPEGTVATRLAWAREKLRSRLARRGVSLGVGLAATEAALSQPCSAAPAALEQATAKAAWLALVGPWQAGPGLSAALITLTEGAMAMATLKTKTLAGALALTLLGGTGLIWLNAAAPQPTPAGPPSKNEPPGAGGGSLGAGGGSAGFGATPGRIADLTRQMRDAAKEAYENTEKKLMLGSSDATVSMLIETSRAWAKAETELAQQPQERSAAIREHGKRLTALLDRQESRYKAGVIPIQEVSFLRYHTLEVERWLEQERLPAGGGGGGAIR